MNKASTEVMQVLGNRSLIRSKKTWFGSNEIRNLKIKLKNFTATTPFCIGKIAYALSVIAKAFDIR